MTTSANLVYNTFMLERSSRLLKSIVDIYTRTAEPVASQILAYSSDFDLSPATIRNDMAELEKDGLIAQPHTSAGRVPTLAGYRFYLDNLLELKSVSDAEIKEFKNLYKNDIRSLAKLIAEKINLATIVGFGPSDLYFTGLFNLFSQPEFEDHRLVLSMSQVVDSLEKAIRSIYYDVDAPRVLLGQDSPFGKNCSLVAASLPDKILLAVLGPVRMDYSRVLGLFKEIVNIAK